MQGLALADFLSAVSTYGFEPLLQLHYSCSYLPDFHFTECDLIKPYCHIALHMSLLSMTSMPYPFSSRPVWAYKRSLQLSFLFGQ